MEIHYIEATQWPKLAWLARCTGGTVTVTHGRGVQTNPQWFCEAAWDGPFDAGDFDLTDIICGSGGRLRDGAISFVTSGSTLDRIQYACKDGTGYVSNSLSCLAQTIGASCHAGYPGYFEYFGTIVDGLEAYEPDLHTTAGDIHLVYFDNLHWSAGQYTTIPKPHADRKFADFGEYYGFLRGAMARLRDNAQDSARRNSLQFVATLSSGYDSTTAATLGAQVGCKTALTFAHARGGEADDGREAARVLGLELHTFDRDAWRSLHGCEPQFIAADAKGEDRYFAVCSSLLENKILLTGFHGDKIWDRRTTKLEPYIVRGDRSGLSLSEFRLRAGFLNCSPAFWGARNIAEVIRISNLPEMQPWDVGGGYSRPICRRIAEGAGIPRSAFGIRKRASSEQAYASPDFLSKESMADYFDWLRAKSRSDEKDGFPLIISPLIDRVIYEAIARSESTANVLKRRLRRSPLLWRFSNSELLWKMAIAKTLATPVYVRRHVFPWALERAKQAYVMPAPT